MNGAELHLALNHFPLFLPGVGILILILSKIRKSEHLEFAALLLFIFGAIFAAVVFQTGEAAEAVIKNYPVAAKRWILPHEQIATRALWLHVLTGVVALWGLQSHCRRKTLSIFLWTGLLVISFLGLAVTAVTSHRGGLIVHEEIRTDEFSGSRALEP